MSLIIKLYILQKIFKYTHIETIDIKGPISPYQQAFLEYLKC